MGQDKRDTVRAVERAIDILQIFSFEGTELSLAQICAMVDLPKTTVFRVLNTLEQRNLIAQDVKTGKYHLGYELIKMGAVAQECNGLSRVAHGAMVEIAQATEQTCNLYIRENLERLCIAQVTGSQYVRRYSYLGARLPLYCGAGKLLLAYAGRDFQRNYFKTVALEGFTEQTVTDPEQLQKELDHILEAGYSVSRGEREEETAMVAVPLFDYTGKAVAAMTVSGPVYYFTEERVSHYIKKLKFEANKLSTMMGYQAK